MNYYQDQLEGKHLTVVNFFRQNKFGSNMPILTYLSTLEPLDRCIILEKIFEEQGGDVVLLDKMLLAYVKVGRVDLAEEVLDIARENGESDFNIDGMEQKLSLGLPPDRSDQQRLVMFKNYLADTKNSREIEFLNLLIKFISK